MWEIPDAKTDDFQRKLLEWYRRGRRRFSWRNGKRTAYQTLIAEMMLRKTDSAKVARLYDAFIARYPSPEALAAADEAALRDEIKLLGIADRARLLRLTARQLIERHGGRIPANAALLMELPGVGRYIANAVLCFAYRHDAALLDTNIIRVIDRVFSVRSDKPRPRDDRKLWEFAASLVPKGKAISYNRALLDFAATICMASKPRCEQCPLQHICDYARTRQCQSEHSEA